MTWRVPTDSAPKRRREWRPAFLAAFASTGNVLLSAKAAGIDRNLPYLERRKNPTFAAAWEQAEEDSVQLLEAEARRRAMSVSDTLLIFLLKSRRPAVYRDNARVELTGAAGGPIQTHQVLAGMDDHERTALRKLIDEVLEGEPA
jgi:hypothetical protein